jgi:hypothetical protein
MNTTYTRQQLLCILATLVLTGTISRLVASPSCRGLDFHPTTDVTCQCHSNATGTDGNCDDRSYHIDYHQFCVGSGSGWWICENTMGDVGWDATCTTEINWTKWTQCYLLAGSLCIYACTAAPGGPGCLACLAAMGKECFGCGLRLCVQGDATPLFCLTPVENDPWGRGCPDNLIVP